MSEREDWTYPTLADTGVRSPTRCRCGRLCRPLELLDVAGLEAADGVPYLCKGCINGLYRQGRLNRIQLYLHRGAPLAWLSQLEAKLLAGPITKTGLPPHIWAEMLADGLNNDLLKAAQKAELEGEPG